MRSARPATMPGESVMTAPSEPMDPHAAKRISHRLRRARGQLDAVIAAVESDDPCRDVVVQLAAVTSALNRAGFAIVSTAMKECLSTPDSQRSDADPTPQEIEKLFMMLA